MHEPRHLPGLTTSQAGTHSHLTPSSGSLITRPPLDLEIILIRRNESIHLEENTVDEKTSDDINAFMGEPSKCLEIRFAKQIKFQIDTKTTVTHCKETAA